MDAAVEIQPELSLLEQHKSALLIMAVGFGLALIAHWFFITAYMVGFMSALVHEIGHSAISIFTGRPSFPRITLAVDAVAVILDQIFILFLFMLAVNAAFVYRMRDVKGWRWFFCAVLLIHALAGFSDTLAEVIILYCGQFGELFFGGIFLWRAWTGGFTENPSERPLYAVLGWVMVQRNFYWGAGLMFSPDVRAEYLMPGGGGGANDLVRVSDMFGISLQTAAFPLLCATLATPVIVAFMAHQWKRHVR